LVYHGPLQIATELGSGVAPSTFTTVYQVAILISFDPEALQAVPWQIRPTGAAQQGVDHLLEP